LVPLFTKRRQSDAFVRVAPKQSGAKDYTELVTLKVFGSTFLQKGAKKRKQKNDI
jgi:hypothetical protein